MIDMLGRGAVWTMLQFPVSRDWDNFTSCYIANFSAIPPLPPFLDSAGRLGAFRMLETGTDPVSLEAHF